MSNSIIQAGINTCRVVLFPIIKMMLRFGISYRAFSEVSKGVYIDIVLDSKTDKKSVSDISARTGISRKEVVRIMEREESLTILSSNRLAVNKVIDNWYVLPDYLNEHGQPTHLPIDSEKEISLKSLIRTAKLDVPYTTIVKIMLSSRSIFVDDNGHYYPSNRAHITEGVDCDSILYVKSSLFAYLDTVQRNFMGENERSLFERRAYVPTLSEENFHLFLDFVDQKMGTLIFDFDRWLREHNNGNEPTSDPTAGSTGIGIYTFHHHGEPY